MIDDFLVRLQGERRAIRLVGSNMSPSGIAVPGAGQEREDGEEDVVCDTLVISMKKFDRIIHIDAEKKLVTIEPGKLSSKKCEVLSI